MASGNKRNQIIYTIKNQTEQFHPSKIAGLTGASVPYVTNVILSLQATGQLEKITEGRTVNYKLIENNIISDPQTSHHHETRITDKITNVIQQYAVADRFDYVQKLVQMVLENITPSLFLTGPAGIGKTFLVKEQLRRNNKIEGRDFIYIKGHSSPLGIYTVLYQHSNHTIVFDDCDKALDNVLAISVLKAALDSYDKRVIHWISRSIPIDSGLERSFEFKGNIIFVSNRELSQVDDTIRSRTLCLNLAMTRKEITEHMRNILPGIEVNQPLVIREEIMDYLAEIENSFQTYNLRTLIKAIRIRARYEDPIVWKPLIKIVAYNE